VAKIVAVGRVSLEFDLKQRFRYLCGWSSAADPFFHWLTFFRWTYDIISSSRVDFASCFCIGCIPSLGDCSGGDDAFLLCWQSSLFRGDPKIPKHSYVLFMGSTFLDILYFIFSWRWGLEYEGAHHTSVVCAVNLIWVCLLGVAFGRASRGASSFRLNLFVYWMLFAWLGWYAFPTLGELP
jgi:hypothetical protein